MVVSRAATPNLLTAYRLSAPARPARPVLDAGCGTGGFLRKLADAIPEQALFGMDIEPVAAELAGQKSAATICVGSINDLPFAANSMSAIFSADVLYHRGVDESRALADLHRCLAPGGVLVLNLPAYDWMMSALMSAHDRAVHTARRYTRTRIQALLREAGSNASPRATGTRCCFRSWCCAASCSPQVKRRAMSWSTPPRSKPCSGPSCASKTWRCKAA
ncbi:MAG: class I SAM-dependent methyltransferase [Aliidongia sp.]